MTKNSALSRMLPEPNIPTPMVMGKVSTGIRKDRKYLLDEALAGHTDRSIEKNLPLKKSRKRVSLKHIGSPQTRSYSAMNWKSKHNRADVTKGDDDCFIMKPCLLRNGYHTENTKLKALGGLQPLIALAGPLAKIFTPDGPALVPIQVARA